MANEKYFFWKNLPDKIHFENKSKIFIGSFGYLEYINSKNTGGAPTLTISLKNKKISMVGLNNLKEQNLKSIKTQNWAKLSEEKVFFLLK